MSNTNLQLNTIDPVYLYNKTEKLVSALYLLTSFISDKEPVKWQIREVGLKLLSQNLPLSDRGVQGSNLISLILSYLTVSYLGGIISEMNHNILKFEFEALKSLVEQEEKERLKGAVYSKDFFSTWGGVYKGQNIVSDRELSVKNTEIKQKDKPNRLSEKTDRQEIIIGLLKKNPALGIKDFVSAIKDCSEKTIQRELVSLVAKGQIKKEGEKRWSRYMLK